MNLFLIIIVIVAIIGALLLLYFTSVSKLNQYKERMKKAESIIEENLEKKQSIIININTSIKKVTGKKDYLKEFIAPDNFINSNIEKDLKLDEAVKLINELNSDFNDLNKDNEFNKYMKNLREIDEVLTGAKNMFNQNAVTSNGLLKTFPYNVISKISNYKIRSYYNNKTDDGD